MKTVFIATSNKGKQDEIARLALQYGDDIQLQFPDASNEIEVVESGITFEENALLKAKAYQHTLKDDSIIFVGDDSGIKIPALGDKPGVFTRRWAGYEMTDKQIVEYCIEQMKDLKGEDRKAVFETVLVSIGKDGGYKMYCGLMEGRILEEPARSTPIEGFPFRSLFWVDELKRPIHEVHDLSLKERAGFLTHREKALSLFFDDIALERSSSR